MRSAVAAMTAVAAIACSDSLGPGDEPDLTGTWLLTAETIPAAATFCTVEFALEIVQTAAPPDDLIQFDLSGTVHSGGVVCGDTLELPDPLLMGAIVRHENGDGAQWFGGPALVFGEELTIVTEGPIEHHARIEGRGTMEFTRGPHRPMAFILTRQ